MRKFSLGIAILMLGVYLSGCAKIVEPGYVGIRVNLFGTQRGVQDYPLLTGMVVYNPITQQVYIFPTFLQNRVWTKAETEGSPNDDSISFNSGEGAVINCDIAMSYSFEAEKVPHIFVEFRQDAEHITSVYLRSRIRSTFGDIAGKMKTAEIFGPKRQELVNNVQNRLNEELKPKGIHFDQISVIGDMRSSDDIMASIHAVIASANRAVEANNNLIRARLDAQSQNLQRQSLSTLVIRKMELDIMQKMVEKWNGQMPQVMGSSNGIILSPEMFGASKQHE